MTQADLEVVYSSSGLAQMIAEQRQLNAQLQQLVQQSTAAARSVDNFGNEAKKTAKEAEFLGFKLSDITKLAGGLGLAFGVRELKDLAIGAVQSAINYETLNVQFEVFLGSAEKAKTTLADLNKFSIETPFTPDQVNAAGRSLLAFGFTTEQLLPTLKMVGDVSSAVGKDFNELATIYGKARTAGTLYAEDINQLTEAGIPIIEELSKVMGVQVDQVKKLGSEGKLHFADLETAFANMTGEGGRFSGMMDKMSQSTAGLMSTIEGKLQDELRAIGQAMLPVVRTVAEGFEPAFKAVKDVITEALGVLGPFYDAVGDLFTAFGFAKTEGNAFANIVKVIAGYFRLVWTPARLFWQIITKLVQGFTWLVGGVKAVIAPIGEVKSAFELALLPIRMVSEAWDYLFGKDKVEAAGLSAQSLTLWGGAVDMARKKMGATNEQIWEFTKAFDKSRLAGLSAKDAMDLVVGEFAKFIKSGKDASGTAAGLATNLGKITTATGPAAGSIAALESQLKSLNERFTATGSELERSQLRQKIDDLGISLKRLKEGADLTTLVPQQVTEQMTDFAAAAERSQRAVEGGLLPPDFVQEIDAKTKAITGLKIAMVDLSRTVGSQLKDAFLQFGIAASEAIGRAIAMGENVGDVFKKVLVDFLVNVPKLVGMALLNAAAGMIGQPAAIPIAAAGLALIGMSALLSGARDKKEMQKQNEVGGIASAPSPSNGRVAAPEGLAQAATAGQMVVLNLDIDGKKFAQATFGATADERRKRIF